MSDLLRVEDLHVSFGLMAGRVEAVRGVSFRVPVGGTVALVGEPGSTGERSSSTTPSFPRPAVMGARRSTSRPCRRGRRRCAPCAATAFRLSFRSR